MYMYENRVFLSSMYYFGLLCDGKKKQENMEGKKNYLIEKRERDSEFQISK